MPALGGGLTLSVEEARSMYLAHQVYWFFRRKARIVFLTACCYAALC